SHMGFVTLGIFVFNVQGLDGAILQMVNHGLITGALFLLVGVIYERTHDRTIAKMGGVAGVAPVYAVALGFFVFASGGLPGLSGFVGEFLVLVGAFEYAPLVAAVATVCMVLAAGYLLWMFQRIAFGEISEFFKSLGHHLTDMTPTEILTLAPAAAQRSSPSRRPRGRRERRSQHDRAAHRRDPDRPPDPRRRPDCPEPPHAGHCRGTDRPGRHGGRDDRGGRELDRDRDDGLR